jgi:CheY-like chemotaxis protein
MAHVLVAEDDAEMRRLVVEALRKAGHSVTEAKDGGALLEQLAETFARDPSLSPVDVIVSDVRMPACNGLELIERLADAGLRVRCVLMTAFSDEETRRRARTAGALFLDKPLSLEALRDAVEWLARRRS